VFDDFSNIYEEATFCFSVIYVFRRRGCASYLVDKKKAVEGGNKKEVMASPLLQQKWRTLQFYCNMGTGLRQ
jgi:hypothetical protein